MITCDDVVPSFEAVVLERRSDFVARDARALVVVPHGGPHSAFAVEHYPVLGEIAD